ncbi:hypothetical protein CesoFtcFv8_023713 [Champsocephalus esox]|uniref:Uncharacterized protein n=1 Tax=Champsocephalus esox TaxID=159716 RepID=A0AAN8B4U7_9TELE|nr:hypothetical protein CesoFtcFv8_023713 [Champsocephalus esox]
MSSTQRHNLSPSRTVRPTTKLAIRPASSQQKHIPSPHPLAYPRERPNPSFIPPRRRPTNPRSSQKQTNPASLTQPLSRRGHDIPKPKRPQQADTPYPPPTPTTPTPHQSLPLKLPLNAPP